MRTSIAGKLENTALPVSRPLAPLYEAIHNSMQAIEDAGDGNHEIIIAIERLSELLEEGVELSPNLGDGRGQAAAV